MRVLLNAFGFSPYRGSECAVGWNIAKELARYHDVTVITGDVSYREDEYLRYVKENGSVPGLTVEYINPTPLIAWINKVHDLPGLWAFYYAAYKGWQKLAYRKAVELHRKKKFDIIHQLNMIGYREPGYLWKIKDAAFVWGPVGGGPNEPISYHSLFSCSGCVKVFLRTVFNEIQKRVSWRARAAAKAAKKIWAVTDADYRMIHDLWGIECERMVETGSVLRPEGFAKTFHQGERLRIVWSGIHTSRKALPILLHALKKASNELGNVTDLFHVDVLGEGPETKRWRDLAERLGIADCLTWHGRLPHEKALDVMNNGHVFAFPSLKEGTPHVVLEALSLGLPVICHDACGMGTVVDGRCGIKVALGNPVMSIDGFGKALQRFVRTPSLVAEKSKGALQRAAELTWEAKAKAISDTYLKLQ